MRSYLAFVLVFAVGCAEWTPIRSAHDVEGQRVKVESAGKQIEIDAVVTCDDKGFIIANVLSDCGDHHTFDTRRDKVRVHDGEAKSNVGIVVTAILAAIFIPAGIVGTAILTAH